MQFAAQISLLIYGTLVSIGGIMGFLKAKSKASLIAGVVSGALLVTAYSVSCRNPQNGFLFGLVITTILTSVFAKRLVKTRSFMPSGLLLILTGIEEILLVIALLAK
ncbi:MAG: TMEM14 family protein [Candidatus Obscuribacterales bacterium]|nr:TMEM14 family protein [Candidatus Obscuribacterales bacterium]